MIRGILLVSLFYLSNLSISYSSSATVKDYSSLVFGGNRTGTIAAFLDFDNNGQNDIFIIRENAIDVILIKTDPTAVQAQDKAYIRHFDIIKELPGYETDGLILADFDGDTHVDALVIYRSRTQSRKISAKVYWGNCVSANECSFLPTPHPIPADFTDHPTVIDCTGNLRPDILGQTVDQPNTVYCWDCSKEERNFTSHPLVGDALRLRKPQSSAYAALFADRGAQVILTTEHDELNFVSRTETGWVSNGSLPYPPVNYGGHYGQLSVTDLDSDSAQELLLPVCDDSTCARSSLYVYQTEQAAWMKAMGPSNFMIDGEQWGFHVGEPITLRVADYDFNGWPDVVVVLQNQKTGKHQAVLLMNHGCWHNSSCVLRPRLAFPTPDDAIRAAFFDFDTGILGVIIVGGSETEPQLYAFFSLQQNGCFMKVAVDVGTSTSWVPLPGASAFFTTSTSDGGTQMSLASQLTQSAHAPLQLPFTLFGLGETPNYVDHLHVDVAVRGAPNSQVVRVLDDVIPNSQVTVTIPVGTGSAARDSADWIVKLLVRPGHTLMVTGLALAGLLVLLALFLALLHFLEKREDQKEKKEQSQKFHFDAM